MLVLKKPYNCTNISHVILQKFHLSIAKKVTQRQAVVYRSAHNK